MKLNTSGKRSFFGKSLSHTTDKDLEPSLISQATQEHAAGVIQRWWKQLHLNQTAIESRHYISQVVSLEQANAKSFSKLETLLLDKDTQTITRNLLMHLEQAKDVIIPLRNRSPNAHRLERKFLSAYLIATKSE